MHSRYRRHLSDLPVSGRPAAVMLTVRRFFCDHLDCSTGTFVEQVPGLTEPHARRSPGLQAALVAIGLALAGRAGSRLATKLGMAVSQSTLPRMIRALPDPPVGDLHRVRCTVPGSVGVPAGPVPADHPHARMGAEPVGEVAGFPAQEHVNRSVPVGQVDQHRAVLVAAAQGNSSTPRTAT